MVEIVADLVSAVRLAGIAVPQQIEFDDAKPRGAFRAVQLRISSWALAPCASKTAFSFASVEANSRR